MKYVFMNSKGEFLQWFKVLNHTPGDRYGFRWGALQDASLGTVGEVGDMMWKDETPKIVTHVPAEEVRTVKLVPAPAGC